MSWIQKLYETYERCAGHPRFAADGDPLLPLQHTMQNAQVEVTLDGQGRFVRAAVVDKERAPTLVPCTEGSASRTGSKPVPHPLCDKLQYLAADFRAHGGEVTIGFQKEEGQPHRDYREQLEAWATAMPHPKLEAIVAYVRAGTLTADLIRARILPVDADGLLLKKASLEDKKNFPLWAVMPAGQPPENAFVRWRVDVPGRADSGTWEDESLVEAWSAYVRQQADTTMLCMVTGRDKVPVARLHPAKIRHAADKAKLISANDGSGFTFRGRFTDGDGLQACSVGDDVTQKAHSALRWLVGRQAYRKGGQVYVAWAVSGAPVPPPLESSPLPGLAQSLWEDAPEPTVDVLPLAAPEHGRDAGQSFALKLRRVMRGYAAGLGPAEDIMVMGVDSATPGRMSIIFYRELAGSEFLARLEDWHLALAWPQRVTLEPEGGKKGKSRVVWPVCAPSPSRIAEAAYGRRLDDKLRNATTERLLACIVDGRALPRDLVESCVRRAANRPVSVQKKDQYEWEQTLGVACALYKGYWARYPRADERRTYSMTLDPQRSTRDYLYGRLLAVAEHLEEGALRLAGEKRPATAARLMQRFADRPYSTWRTIELSLVPYTQRLQARRPGSLRFLKTLMGTICDQFNPDEFVSDARLSGEFLLGYHCQLQDLHIKHAANAVEPEITADSEETPYV